MSGSALGPPPAAEGTARERNGGLRVLHCLWDGGIGGTERAVYQLVREQLRDPALAPAVLFADGAGPYWERTKALGCPVIVLGLANGHAIGRLPRIASAMRRFEIHHFHSAEPLLMLASILSGPVGRAYTHRGGIIRYPPKKQFQYRIVGLLLRHWFHGLSGNTHHAARCAAELFRLDADPFQVTYNGLEFDLLIPSRSAEAVRRELGLHDEHFVVGTTAKLKEWKRIDRLLEALGELADPRARLLVVGEGPDLPRLQTLAHDLAVQDRVRFAGSQDNVADFLQVMDAFCLPSMGLESFGNAAVEAMASGTPTIVFSDGGGMIEHIRPGKTGLVVDNQPELVQSIRTLIEDPDLRRELGTQGMVAVRRRYTPAKAASAYRELYASTQRSQRLHVA